MAVSVKASKVNSLVREKLFSFLWGTLAIIVLILASPFIFLYLIVDFLYGVLLIVLVWGSWGKKSDMPVLLVYSNSPNWQDYVEDNLLPKIPQDSIILNWSERKEWKKYSLSVLAFRYFGGDQEFNPIAIVFQRWRWPKTYRFWSAFKEKKHGNPEPLVELESEFYNTINSPN